MSPDDLIAKHYNTAKSLAHQMKIPTDSADFDDLVQEGAVAAWLATSKEERRDPVVYGMVAARRRITGHLKGRTPMLGSEREEGRIYDLHRQSDKRDNEESAPEKLGPDEYATLDLRLDLDAVLSSLEPKDQQIARSLSLGLNWSEVGQLVGSTGNAVQKRWKRVLQPQLAVALA